MKKVGRKYIPLSTEPLQISLESRILAGSVVTSDTIVTPAVQEKGLEVDMSQDGFNHEWE